VHFWCTDNVFAEHPFFARFWTAEILSWPADRGPFDEGAAQVKKLLTRDKRELMGVEQIGQRARTEFDEDDSTPSTSDSANGSSSKPSTRLFGEGQYSR